MASGGSLDGPLRAMGMQFLATRAKGARDVRRSCNFSALLHTYKR